MKEASLSGIVWMVVPSNVLGASRGDRHGHRAPHEGPCACARPAIGQRMRTLEASGTQGELAQMDQAQADETIYRDLVDERLETPLAEYKRWMSLAEKVARANIARHICALADSGGGPHHFRVRG